MEAILAVLVAVLGFLLFRSKKSGELIERTRAVEEEAVRLDEPDEREESVRLELEEIDEKLEEIVEPEPITDADDAAAWLRERIRAREAKDRR